MNCVGTQEVGPAWRERGLGSPTGGCLCPLAPPGPLLLAAGNFLALHTSWAWCLSRNNEARPHELQPSQAVLPGLPWQRQEGDYHSLASSSCLRFSSDQVPTDSSSLPPRGLQVETSAFAFLSFCPLLCATQQAHYPENTACKMYFPALGPSDVVVINTNVSSPLGFSNCSCLRC